MLKFMGMLALFAVLLMGLAGVASAQVFNITPYSNSTQVGYHVTNSSTSDSDSIYINGEYLYFVQNFITPNESGVTVDNTSYYLYLNRPVALVQGNNSYLVLYQINYIPRLHTADFNIYENQPPSTTTTTATTTSTTMVPTTSKTTTILPTTATSTAAVASTTVAQSSGSSPGGMSTLITILIAIIIILVIAIIAVMISILRLRRRIRHHHHRTGA